MNYQKKIILYFIVIMGFFVAYSSLFSCCRPELEYGSYWDSTPLHNYITTAPIQQDEPLVDTQLKIYIPQTLMAFCCNAFVKNSQKTMEQQLASKDFAYPDTIAKTLVSSALALTKKDLERVHKIIAILKKMPLELYGDFAFLINRQKGNIENDTLSNEEKHTILTVLQYMPNSIDQTRIAIIDFFMKKYEFESTLFQHSISNNDGVNQLVAPYQIVEVLLRNNINPSRFSHEQLIPATIVGLDTMNFLKKIGLILKAHCSRRDYYKQRAQKLLTAWTVKAKIRDGYYEYNPQNGSPEEIENNLKFYTDVLALIELSEINESICIDDQTLPF